MGSEDFDFYREIISSKAICNIIYEQSLQNDCVFLVSVFFPFYLFTLSQCKICDIYGLTASSPRTKETKLSCFKGQDVSSDKI